MEPRRLGIGIGIATLLFVGGTAAWAQEFGYSGALGPAHWGALSPAWATCSTGREQSPVDVGPLTLLTALAPVLRLDYGDTHGQIFNNGHTVEVETEGENDLVLQGVRYRLIQFHFHSPSEHTFNGRGADMELHLVHRNAAGALAVIGVLMRRAPTSGPLAQVFDHLPDEGEIDVREELPSPFNPRTFLPASLAHVRFGGSLTTPPCTEGVRWMVLLHPIAISDEHMARFNQLIQFNARPVQRRRP